MNKAVKNIENYAKTIIALIIFLRIQFIIRYLSLKNIYLIARLMGWLCRKLYPSSSKEILFYFDKSKIDSIEKNQFIKQYFSNLFYNTLLLTIFPFISYQKIDKIVDSSAIHDYLNKNKDKRLLVGGIHFYNFLTITTLSNIAKSYDRKAFGSFAFAESFWISYFFKAIKRKFHYNFHYPFNVAIERNGLQKLEEIYNQTNSDIFLFTDVRFRKKPTDVSFKIKDLDVYSDAGFNYAINKFTDLTPVIFYLKIKPDYTFEYTVQEISKQQIKNSYDMISKIITENFEEWQMWFFTPMFKND